MSHGVVEKKGECLENDSGLSRGLMESIYKRREQKNVSFVRIFLLILH